MLSLFGFTQLSLATELPPQIVGPFDFKEVPITSAIKTIFGTSGIEVVPSNMPKASVTALQVEGTLPDVMKALSDQADLTYNYKNGKLYVYGNQVDPTPVAVEAPVVVAKAPVAVAPVKAPVVVAKKDEPKQVDTSSIEPSRVIKTVVTDAKPVETKVSAAVVAPVVAAPVVKTYSTRLVAGLGVKAVLETAAKANGYILNWEGEDLYVRYGANFTGSTFEDMLNQIFSSIKVNGYISNNANNGREIYVVTK